MVAHKMAGETTTHPPRCQPHLDQQCCEDGSAAVPEAGDTAPGLTAQPGTGDGSASRRSPHGALKSTCGREPEAGLWPPNHLTLQALSSLRDGSHCCKISCVLNNSNNKMLNHFQLKPLIRSLVLHILSPGVQWLSQGHKTGLKPS